ncbi:nitroreductase family protein [Nocardioides sp. J2M5]|uniref:Acg family FMN-binding oxidoreductase n=1 Tax=Nocardioides palaemonis TaxID=2829810 RepID=UPI001BA521C9|nr:nitroreductase family protein [Nocardioides palaemonis]MBS2937864.1 nitroreductase family protein [Nocardioides palaemonis]
MTARPAVPDRVVRQVVGAACLAPSVHNTQPWRWRTSGRGLELHADRRRQLEVADPLGRNLVISCGAALHHATVAAAALGWVPTVERLPDPRRADLLARITLEAGPPPPHGAETLDLLARRSTDRRRFTSWPVPEERLERLAAVANEQGARAVALTEVSERFRAERLVLLAAQLQRSRPTARAEQEEWLDRGPVDGIPREALPEPSHRAGAYAQRFDTAPLHAVPGPDLESSDGLVVLFDGQDDPAAWLRAGEGLSALWLAATADGLSVVPLSQLVEVPETRRAFQHDVLGGLAHPLVLVRVGWQAIGRDDLVRTPRRPLDDVLETG